MATVQERLARMKQDGQAVQTADIQKRLDRMKQDGAVVAAPLQSVPAITLPAVQQGVPAAPLPTAQQGVVNLLRAGASAADTAADGGPRRTDTGWWWPGATPSFAPLPRMRSTQEVQEEMDGLDRAIRELKGRKDVFDRSRGAGEWELDSTLREGPDGPTVALEGPSQALEEEIARLEHDRAALQEEWNQADERQFARIRSTEEYRAAVDKAMNAPFGMSVDNIRNPDYRDIRSAMTYFQAKSIGDEPMAAASLQSADMALDRMNARQRERLAYYVGIGDYDGAAEYLNRIAPSLNQAQSEELEQRLAEWAQEHPVQGALTNVVSWPLNIPAYAANTRQAAKNLLTGKDERDPHASAYGLTRIGSGTAQGTSEAARAAAVEAFGNETAGDVAAFLTSTGLSIGQNASQVALLGPASLVGMSLSAAGSATSDALARGATPEQAFAVGTASGAIEAVTEKIPLDNLLRIAKEGGGQGAKAVAREILQQMATEATEESISEIANNLVDAAVMGDSSEYRLYVKELEAAGLSKDEAERQAFQQFYIWNVLTSAAGGAISGGVMGGGAELFHRAGQYSKQLNGNAQGADRVSAAVDQAYQAMAEKGVFSQEAGQAVEKVREAAGGDTTLLPTGERSIDIRGREGITLPGNGTGVEFLPGNQGILLPTGTDGQGAVQSAQEAAEGPPVEAAENIEIEPSAQVSTPDGPAVQPANIEGSAAGTAQGETQVKSRAEEIKDVIQGLRDSLAQGRISEEAFDGALDHIMEQEGLEGLDMLDERALGSAARPAESTATTEGGADHGAGEFERTAATAGQQLPGGDEGRVPGAGTGGQAGILAEGGPRRAADAGRRAVDRQNIGRDLRLQAVSSRELGISGGTDAKNVRVLPEDAWDGELRDAARKVRRETGLGVRFVLGGIQVTGSDGGSHQVRGVYTPEVIIVQADHMQVSPGQIADHEIFHDYARRDPGLVRAVEETIADRYGREELRGILADYAKGLRGIVDVSENGMALEDEQALEDLKNEVFADAYAGINAFGGHAERYQGEVLDTLESRGAEAAQGRETAQATDRRTGPPEAQRFSYEGRTEDGIEIYETSEEIKRLPYKQRVAAFLDIMRGEYRGRTAKFTAGDGQVYYARFSGKDLNKNVYGDKRSSSQGLAAKVNVGADGSIFELVENAQYSGSKSESGKSSRAHSGVSSWDYFVKTVQIDGQLYDLLANVRKKPGGEYVYSIQLNENKYKAPAPSLASSHSMNGDAQDRMLTGASGDSVAQDGGVVKPWDGTLPTGTEGGRTLPGGEDFWGDARYSADEAEPDGADTDAGRISDGMTLPTYAQVEARRSQEVTQAARETAQEVQEGGDAARDTPIPQESGDAAQGPQKAAEGQSNTVIDALPRKAQDYLRRAERRLVNKVGELLSMPKSAQRAFLQDIVRDISAEYLSTGQVSQATRDTLFERAYEQGIQADREYYDNYKHVRDYLRTTPITVSEQARGDITDYNDWRKGAFGTLRLVNQGGIGIDTAYMELQDMAPGLFPEDVSHPGDQLRQILEAAQGIRISERSLDEYYGPDAEEFRRFARKDFDEAVADALGELKRVKRYADERAQRAAGRNAEGAPLTTQEVSALWGKLKGARRTYEHAAARNLLTQHDEIQVGRLLRGELELDMLNPAKDNVKGITAIYEAKLEYEELAGQLREWNNRRRAALREQADGFLESANNWKDKKAGLLYARETMERNIRDIVPDEELAERINRAYFQPVHEAAAKANRAKNAYRDRVRGLELSRKAAKGDLVSEAHAVQLLGEAEDNIQILEQSQGRVEKRDGKTLEEWQAAVGKLWEENPGLDQEKIRGAVKEFRAIYDELFQQMNETRVRNGYAPVNYRRGYFPHFQPGGEGIMALFGKALGIDTAVANLPTTINGLTHTFKPGIQWFGNAQERLGFNTVYDAVEGFDRYIEGVADVIYQTDNIQALRALAGQARYRTGDDGLRQQVDRVRSNPNLTEEQKQNEIDKINSEGKFALNNFVVELDEYTNLLANKKSRGDRDMEQNLGRRAYKLAKWLEGRAAANMVAVNLASWLTNFVPLTQGWATLDRGMLLKGMWGTLKAYRADDGLVGMSSFLTNRRGSDPLVKTWSQGVSAVLSSPMEYIDQFTADSLVRARFQQNVEKGLSESTAMEEADAWAAGVMADRSKGAIPTLFGRTNPLTKVFTQFQLEVNNQLSYLFKDMPRDWKEKGLAAACAMLLKFLLGAYLYNDVYEYFVGRRCALDPLGILNDTVGDFTGYEMPNLIELGVGAATGNLPSFETEKQNPYEAAAGLFGNVAEELPFIGGVLGGGRVPISSAMPDWENLGKAALNTDWSPERRLSAAANALSGPATYSILPFGGGQIKKIYQGLKAVGQGGSYSVDAQGNDILQYPVFNETGRDKLLALPTALLFGKSALPTARDWADSGFKGLSAKETACYQGMTELGVPQRDAFELLQEIGRVTAPEGDDIPAEERAAYQKRKLLEEADISAVGKSVVYYGLMASGEERGLMDGLAEGGADMGEAARVLMEIKDANALEAGKSWAEKKAISSSLLSEEEKDAVFRYVLPEGSKGAEYSKNLAEAGLDRHSAAAVANALNSLTPVEGKETVSDVQKWRAVIDTAHGAENQKAALLTVMSDSARSRYEVADSFGIQPEAWVQVKEALPQFDANGNGSYSGGEIENAIDALCGDGALLAPWDKDPLRLSREEKAVLWQLFTGNKSGSGNPYSARVGRQTAKALEEMKE